MIFLLLYCNYHLEYFHGTSLKNRSIPVPGNTFKIGMWTSWADNAYGFRVVSITEETDLEAIDFYSRFITELMDDGTLKIVDYVSSDPDVTIPASVDGIPVSTIGYRAFRSNGFITSIVMNEGITCIEDNAFEGCSGATSITIPSSVTQIGEYAFEYCYKLRASRSPKTSRASKKARSSAAAS